jgi:hypothetical protein
MLKVCHELFPDESNMKQKTKPKKRSYERDLHNSLCYEPPTTDPCTKDHNLSEIKFKNSKIRQSQFLSKRVSFGLDSLENIDISPFEVDVYELNLNQIKGMNKKISKNVGLNDDLNENADF